MWRLTWYIYFGNRLKLVLYLGNYDTWTIYGWYIWFMNNERHGSVIPDQARKLCLWNEHFKERLNHAAPPNTAFSPLPTAAPLAGQIVHVSNLMSSIKTFTSSVLKFPVFKSHCSRLHIWSLMETEPCCKGEPRPCKLCTEKNSVLSPERQKFALPQLANHSCSVRFGAFHLKALANAQHR